MTPEQNRRYYASKFEIKSSRTNISARCPWHDDRIASLSVNLDSGLWYCHACCFGGSPLEYEMRSAGVSRLEARKAINKLLGVTDYDYSREPEAVYEYRDESGHPLFRKLRYYGKHFSIEHYDNGSWLPDLEGTRRVLYNLPKVLTSNHIFIVEGEKDAIRIESTPLAGLDPTGFSKCAATCNFDGAGKWLPEYNPYFAGKQVAILADNDSKGTAHAKMVAQSVSVYAAQTKLVTLPNLPEHGDVSDFLDKFTPADLLTVIRATPTYTAGGRELLVTAPAFNGMHSPEIDWLVEGLVQRGANGFVGAPPKTGKSWLVEDLAISLATGQLFLGLRTKRSKVALISREDNPGLTRWRLRELCRGKGLQVDNLGENLWVNTREQSAYFAIDDPGTCSEMVKHLRAVKPELAIFDVLNVLHHADENDNTEMRAILQSLSNIQAEAGCAICVCHHFNKLKEGTLIERLRGSSAISGWAEWIIGIDPFKETIYRRCRFETKAAAPPEEIWFTISSEGECAWVTPCQPPLQAGGKAGSVLQ